MQSVPQSEIAGPKFEPAPPALPVRTSLPAQTAAIILAHMRAGRWQSWLPGERKLGQEFRVSRGTVRSALEILCAQKTIVTEPSAGYRVLLRTRRRSGVQSRPVVGVLSPEPLENRRPYFASLLDCLRDAAQARGWSLHRYFGDVYFGPAAATHLDRLCVASGCTCWIVVRSTRPVQNWFWRQQLPTLVSGNTYEDVALPSLDIDHRAAGRHAGHLLARAGHRRVALVTSRPRLPGLVAGEAGFVEAFCAAPHPENRFERLPSDSDAALLARAVRKRFGQHDRPTAIITETPNQYLTALSALAQMGLTVPGEVSLLSRLDDPFLAHVVPVPARYRVEPTLFARALTTLVSHLVNGEKLPPIARYIVPDYIPGGSVEPADASL